MKRGPVALPVIGRLPRYYRVINALYQDNCIRISSRTLADRLGLTASQIRQDFSCFGGFGQQGYGYNVKYLREEIQEILGLNEENTAILVGCGHLGHALLQNFDFSLCGFTMGAAFDIDPTITGHAVAEIPIHPIQDLAAYLQLAKPDMAVLTVPPAVAQETAELLEQHGVRGIWNFTSAELVLPPTVQVETVNFADSLLTLSYKLKEEAG
jgi:redox-sensing transcriptional repressor